MTDAEKLKRIMQDPLLWMTSFASVPDKQGRVVKFQPTPQQKYLMQNKSKYNIILKARQGGISTVVMLYACYLALTRQNVTCLLMSYSTQSVTENFSKLRAFYDYLPDVVKKEETANSRTQLSFINHSKIICCTCGSTDKSRGSSIVLAHVSEAGLCKDENLEKQLLAIEQALVPGGEIFIESTAKGINYFHTLWNKAVSHENNYKPVFFPWYKEKRMFASEYIEFSDVFKAREGHYLTVEELDEYEKWLYEQGTTLQMIMWRRIKIANSSEESFAQEFPATPEEAFLNSDGANVFDTKLINEQIINVKRNIKELPLPNDMPPTMRKWKKYLKVWKYPEKGKRFYAGIDSAEGLSGDRDYSVMSVLDAEGFQCAEFRCNKIKPYEFTQLVYDLAVYFQKALLCPERASSGHVVIDKLKEEYHYNNIMRYQTYDDRGRKGRKKWGWESNSKSKPIMINRFVEWFETREIFICSLDTLHEMTLYQNIDGSMNGVGGHDDTVIATGLACEALHYKNHFLTS